MVPIGGAIRPHRAPPSRWAPHASETGASSDIPPWKAATRGAPARRLSTRPERAQLQPTRPARKGPNDTSRGTGTNRHHVPSIRARVSTNVRTARGSIDGLPIPGSDPPLAWSAPRVRGARRVRLHQPLLKPATHHLWSRRNRVSALGNACADDHARTIANARLRTRNQGDATRRCPGGGCSAT